jgi:hypothetical protein
MSRYHPSHPHNPELGSLLIYPPAISPFNTIEGICDRDFTESLDALETCIDVRFDDLHALDNVENLQGRR